MIGIPHRYLTHELPGIGGVIRARLEDFVVEEVPLYRACGEGEHVYFEIEKRDLSTLEALEWIARGLGRQLQDFGYAGLKDRKGITRQTLSLQGTTPEQVESLDVPKIRVLASSRHTNKLRVGHLRGNRFILRVREIEGDVRDRVAAILERLCELGLPNYFGPQRFGNRGDAQWVGGALLRHDPKSAIRRVLGCPASTENNPHVVAARYLFQQYRWCEALERFPVSYREERRMLQYLVRAGEKYGGAVRLMRPQILRLYFSAFQSFLFNIVVERRLERTDGQLGRLWDGDVAFLHRNGAVFTVGEAESEQSRADRFEISPSGPIFGKKTVHPRGEAREIETQVVDEGGCRVADFHQLQQRCGLSGGRRPLRVPIEDLEWEQDDEGLRLSFFLPKGSYATTLLREIMKNEEVPSGYRSDPGVS
jgi:tRNA pseudouridine13 synthase